MNNRRRSVVVSLLQRSDISRRCCLASFTFGVQFVLSIGDEKTRACTCGL